MSGRAKKKIRDRVAARVLDKTITPDEGRRALAAAGVPFKGQTAARAAAKSAPAPRRPAPGTDTVYKSQQAALTVQQRSFLEVYSTHSSPAVREAAYRAAYPEGGDHVKTPLEIDRMWDRQALKAARALTPAHAMAEAAVAAEDQDELARERREHVQHEVDPYMHEAPEVAHLDVGKLYRQALDVPAHPDFPAPGPISPEAFRRGPVDAGEAAYSPGYAPPGQAVPVPSATPAAGMLTRPSLSDGQARPCAPSGPAGR